VLYAQGPNFCGKKEGEKCKILGWKAHGEIGGWLSACSAHTPGTHPGNAAFPCGAHRVCARSSSDTARAAVDEWQRTRVDLCWPARRHFRPQQPQVRRRASAPRTSAPSAGVNSERTQRRAPLDTLSAQRLIPAPHSLRTPPHSRERGKNQCLRCDERQLLSGVSSG
jgi:hypothetical protein